MQRDIISDNAHLKSETGCSAEQESSKSSQNVSISSTIGPDCANIDYSPPYDDFATLSSDLLYKDDIWEPATKFKFPFR